MLVGSNLQLGIEETEEMVGLGGTAVQEAVFSVMWRVFHSSSVRPVFTILGAHPELPF